MPTYQNEQYELCATTYHVDALSQAEAIAKLFAGQGQPVDQSQEFIEVATDNGLPTDNHRDLAEALKRLGVFVRESIIPSIRSIEKV